MDDSTFLSREQVRRVDALAAERYGLAGIVLMENAGRGAAEIIEREYGPRGRAYIVCGTGNNGGDGLVIARHLHNFGWRVRVLAAGERKTMSPDCAANDRIVAAMAMDRTLAADEQSQLRAIAGIRSDEVVVDALLGTGFHGEVRGGTARLIRALNQAPKRALVAVDVPSGLDCDTGRPGGVSIEADLTVTFVARKKGFSIPAAHPYVGRCEVAHIGAPRELIDEVIKER